MRHSPGGQTGDEVRETFRWIDVSARAVERHHADAGTWSDDRWCDWLEAAESLMRRYGAEQVQRWGRATFNTQVRKWLAKNRRKPT